VTRTDAPLRLPARLNGRACSFEDALDAAADLLATARLPLVYGLVESTVEAQQAAVRLADLLGAIVDTASSAAHQASQGAFERVGLLTASLGEVRRRANLIVFWACDPESVHPGFVERYAPARAGRDRLAVDVGGARGPAEIEERLALPGESDVDALLVLRAFVRGRRIEASVADRAGLPLEALRGLATRLTSCGQGALFHDGDPPPHRRDPEGAQALGLLVRDAHAKARLRLVGVRAPGNAVGAENVLTWQTGFPAAISFTGGSPRYGPGEFSAETLLARREADAALVVGALPSSHLSDEAMGHLGRLPVIQIGGGEAAGDGGARVFFQAAAFRETAGRVYRMDGVALRQRPAEENSGARDLPTEATVLSRLAERIAQRPAGGRG
jgi:formylmethanofuran dehydrogenase subunit B